MKCDVNCMNCMVDAFKHDLCDEEFCEKYKAIGNAEDFVKLIKPRHAKWIDLDSDKYKWIIKCSDVSDTNFGDMISRRAAIEEFYNLEIEIRPSAIDAVTNMLKNLPSMHTEYKAIGNEEDFIKCKDCKHRFLQNQIWQCPFTIPASENHFCGYAERRTDETN